jgi:signal peptidase
MALKTLKELNLDFIGYSQTHEQKTTFISMVTHRPKIPHAPNPELQESMEPSGRKKCKLKNAEVLDRLSIPKRSKKRRGLFAAISDIVFSLAIIMILFVVLISGSDRGQPKSFFSYSYFAVVTASMQDEIPQGSFILVKQMDPTALEVGDNITYMVDQSTSVTHKVVDIYEDYDSSGARGFKTKGVNNANPDKEIVYEANVVGKVVLVLPVVGAFLTNLSENVFLVFIIFGLCILLSFVLRGVFTKGAVHVPPEKTKV